jgi:very-short-patch-repair endonuclease
VQEAAERLRRDETPAEALLWAALRGKKLAGTKFRRQYAIGAFVLDFCAPEVRLAVEIDGSQHTTAVEHDQARTELLAAYNYTVIRFTNDQVLHSLPEVLEDIRHVIIHLHNGNLRSENPPP